MCVWGEGQFPLGILGLKNPGPYHPLRLRGSPLGSGSSSCPDDPKESLDQISALPWRRGRDAASMVGGSCEVGAGCLGDDGSPGADRAQSLVLCRMWKFRRWKGAAHRQERRTGSTGSEKRGQSAGPGR